MAEIEKVHPDCPNASNPYHECAEHCFQKITEARARKGKKSSGPILLNGTRSFDRRKESKSQTKSLQVLNTFPASNAHHPADAPSPQLQSKKEVDSGDVEPPSMFQQHFKETSVQDAILPDPPVDHPNGNLKSRKQDHSKDNFKSTKQEQNGKLHTPSEIVPYPDSDDVEGTKVPAVRSLSFNFSGITHDFEDSDEEEVLSMISDADSRVWVGKYNVKASICSILQAIFDKHGDIAADCQLESLALRAYYLECVCFVIQELQSTPVIHLTKSKIKEMLAILKDVESAQIRVGWLRRVLNEIVEIIEPITQLRAIEAAKASTKKELELQMEDLALKEKEVAIAKERIAETKARLTEIELEFAQFSKNLSSIMSKVENFDFKALLDELL